MQPGKTFSTTTILWIAILHWVFIHSLIPLLACQCLPFAFVDPFMHPINIPVLFLSFFSFFEFIWVMCYVQ